MLLVRPSSSGFFKLSSSCLNRSTIWVMTAFVDYNPILSTNTFVSHSSECASMKKATKSVHTWSTGLQWSHLLFSSRKIGRLAITMYAMSTIYCGLYGFPASSPISLRPSIDLNIISIGLVRHCGNIFIMGADLFRRNIYVNRE